MGLYTHHALCHKNIIWQFNEEKCSLNGLLGVCGNFTNESTLTWDQRWQWGRRRQAVESSPFLWRQPCSCVPTPGWHWTWWPPPWTDTQSRRWAPDSPGHSGPLGSPPPTHTHIHTLWNSLTLCWDKLWSHEQVLFMMPIYNIYNNKVWKEVKLFKTASDWHYNIHLVKHLFFLKAQMGTMPNIPKYVNCFNITFLTTQAEGSNS